MEKYNISSALLKSKKTFWDFIPIKIFILLTLQTLLTFNLFSQPVTQEWVRRYDNPEHSGDGAAAVSLDNAGNIYVTGSSANSVQNNNIVTIKYNPAGYSQWERIYNGTGNDRDVPSAMFVDSIGNVYITGYSVGSGTGEDYITIKYNNNGTQLWAARYNGPVSGNDNGSGITVDKNGYVYVTGGSSGDVVTIKYASNGDSVWVKRFHEYQRSDAGGWIKLDSIGNVYILARCLYSYPPIASYLTIKYSPNGDSLWSVKYYNTVYSENYPSGMDIDKFGNVYVTGYSTGNNTSDDYATVKYNPNGVQQWVARYNGPASSGDKPWGLLVDKNSNVYVTGQSVGQISTTDDYLTIKYNSNGDSLWVRRYNGTGNSYDDAYAIAIDDSSNVYITGRSINSNNGFDFCTLRYNTNGLQQWVIRYPGVGRSITVNRIGNVYVTGANSEGGTGTDIITLKYSQFVRVSQITNETPQYFLLSQNYPNPFNPNTKIKFSLPSPSKGGVMDVKLVIYDVLGREVTNLIPPLRGGQEGLPAGIYEVDWDGSNYPSGVYFYRLVAGNYTETKKMVLVK